MIANTTANRRIDNIPPLNLFNLRLLATLCFLWVASFGASGVWALTVGEGADDRPESIPVYADAVAYLADTNGEDASRFVTIGDLTLPGYQVREFHRLTGLTNSNLVNTYTNAAAYNADLNRGGYLYATFNGISDPFLVTALQAVSVTDENLGNNDVPPHSEGARFATTAVGDGARALEYDATAVGESALAYGESTAIGQFASALGDKSTALGDHSGAYGDRSLALGRYSHAAGDKSTAVGGHASTYGDDATALGRYTHALGTGSTALGRGAITAKPSIHDTANDDIGTLIECAVSPRFSDQGFIAGCAKFITDEEKADPRYELGTVGFDDLRGEIQTRLIALLDDLSTDRATAVGAYAWAQGDLSTVVGYGSRALGDRSTVVGQRAIATGMRGSAFGQYAMATSQRSSAFGSYAQAHGEGNVAIGANSEAGGLGHVFHHYTTVADYLKGADFRNDYLASPPSGDTYVYELVIIGGSIYRIAELDAISGLSEDNLPATLSGKKYATAVGAYARAQGEYSTVAGFRAQALGDFGTVVGQRAIATGMRGSAFGQYAMATSQRSSAFGSYAQAHGEGNVAIGANSETGGLGPVFHPYTTVADYLEGADFRNAYLASPPSDDTNVYELVIIGGSIYRIAELDAISGLSEDNLPAALAAGKKYATALGFEAEARGERSTAVGTGAVATRDNQIVLGVAARVDDSTTTGVDEFRAASAYTLPGLPAASGRAAQTGPVQLVTTDADGNLATDGGALHRAVGAAGDAADADGSAYARIAKNKQDLEAETTARTSGDVALRAGLTTETTARDALEGKVAVIQTTLENLSSTEGVAVATLDAKVGDTDDEASVGGSAFARIAQNKEDLAAETTARTNDDAALRADLATETTVRTNGDAALRADLETETTARTNDDAALRADLATETTARTNDDAALRADLATETTARTNDDAALHADLATETTARTASDQMLRNDLGTDTDAAAASGSAFAQITHLKNAFESATSEDMAIANAISRATEAQQGVTVVVQKNEVGKIYDESGVKEEVLTVTMDAEGRTIVQLQGNNIREQFASLVATLTERAAPDTVQLGADGNPIGTTTAEFNNLDEGGLASGNRLGYLFEALYGNPRDGIVNSSTTDSDMPTENSVFGRIQQGVLRSTYDAEKGLDTNGNLPGAGGYREAPVIGSGDDTPKTAAGRRVVVQDTNADGTVRLSTVSLDGALSGMDRRVDGLSERLDKGIAMSAALTALPNTTPGNDRYALGLGLGSHSGETAFAMGFSGRFGQSTHFNLGAASSGSGSTTSRAGMSWSW